MERNSSNSFRQYFPFTTLLAQKLTSRFARQVYSSVFLILILLVTAAHIRSYLMVRQFQRVLSGLSHVQIDKTTEEELERSVPYLVRGPAETGRDTRVERYYYLVLSNEDNWLTRKLYFGNLGYWISHDRAIKIAEWLGYRYTTFYAQVLAIDGTVSRIKYEIAGEWTDRLGFIDFISVRSAHGLWGQVDPTVVTPAADERPQFQVSGDEKSLHVTYMFDAAPEQTSRAFDINLSCFWSFRSCRAAGEIAPLFWKYKNEVEEKAASRLVSSEPCPSRILAGRVRYLPGLDILLLDVEKVPDQLSVDEWGRLGKSRISYRLREIIRGSRGESQEAKKQKYYPEIRASSNLSWRSSNTLSRVPQIGDQVLLFTGAQFQSCQLVSNAPSALSAIQRTAPMPRRAEDEILNKGL